MRATLTLSLAAILAICAASLPALAYTNPNGQYPAIPAGTELDFTGPDGSTIQLMCRTGTRDNVYAGGSSGETVTAADLALGQAIVAYTNAGSAHGEDFEGMSTGYGYNPMVTYPQATRYRQGPALASTWAKYTEVFGGRTAVMQITPVAALPTNVAAGLANWAGPKDVTQPLVIPNGYPGYNGTQKLPVGTLLEMAKNITQEIDVTTSNGVYRMVRIAPSAYFGGPLWPISKTLFAIYIPGTQKLYFAGDSDPTVFVYGPSGEILYHGTGAANDTGCTVISNVASISAINQTSSWGSPVNGGYEASEPQYYMVATSPQLVPQPPDGTITSDEVEVKTKGRATISWNLK